MSGGADVKAYEGRSITVTFEAGRCLHAAECVCACRRSGRQPYCGHSGPCVSDAVVPSPHQ
jgi:uncharacterized Fe-S cluster protein YjdI